MATNTTNYGFKKPDESDFYDVNDQNNNWDLADDALKELDTPTFEDYTGDTEVPEAATALEKIKSKGKLATLLSNIKAFCKGCCTLAMIVDNCTTDRSDLPGSAKQLKVLMDLYNVLNTNQILIKKFQFKIKTSESKDGASGMYLGNCYLRDIESYPNSENTIILAVIPYGARSEYDASRPAIIAYRDTDTFLSVGSPNQGDANFYVQVIILYKQLSS